jgi:DNA-binding NarL/FixJ family response regulator
MLRYFEDMTEPEIAATLGISLGTVKSAVSRTVTKLLIDAGIPALSTPALQEGCVEIQNPYKSTRFS